MHFLHSSSPCPVPFLLFQHWHTCLEMIHSHTAGLGLRYQEYQRGISKILSEVSFWKHYFGFRAGLKERMGKEKQGQLQLFACIEDCCRPSPTPSMWRAANVSGAEPAFWCFRASGQLQDRLNYAGAFHTEIHNSNCVSPADSLPLGSSRLHSTIACHHLTHGTTGSSTFTLISATCLSPLGCEPQLCSCCFA